MRECVGIISDNSIGIVDTILDIWNSDRVAVIINHDTAKDFLQCIIKENEINECYVNGSLLTDYKQLLPEICFLPFETKESNCIGINTYEKYQDNYSKEDAIILYSSGTTGRGKGIVLSHYAITCNADAIIDYMKPSPIDRFYVIKNFCHSSTLVGEILVALKCKIPLYVAQHNIYINKLFYDMEKYNITITFLNPTLLALMVQELKKTNIKHLPKLRKIYVSGSVLDDSLLREAKSVFEPSKIYNVYGMTEMGPRISSQELSIHYNNNSVGKAIKGVKIVIHSYDDGSIIHEINKKGIIYVKTPCLFSRYNSSVNISKELYNNEWLSSGDIGYWDEYHNLYITGRADNMVTCTGHNVFVENIETMIKSNLPVKECLIVGKKDSIQGHILVCYYNSEGVTPKEIYCICREKLASYEIPKSFIPVKEFIYSNGKIKRSYYQTMLETDMSD